MARRRSPEPHQTPSLLLSLLRGLLLPGSQQRAGDFLSLEPGTRSQRRVHPLRARGSSAPTRRLRRLLRAPGSGRGAAGGPRPTRAGGSSGRAGGRAGAGWWLGVWAPGRSQRSGCPRGSYKAGRWRRRRLGAQAERSAAGRSSRSRARRARSPESRAARQGLHPASQTSHSAACPRPGALGPRPPDAPASALRPGRRGTQPGRPTGR